MHSEENTHILHITIKKYYNIFKTHIYLRISRKCGRSETIQTDATNIFESLGFRGEKKRPFISQTNKIKRKHHGKPRLHERNVFGFILQIERKKGIGN